MMKKQYIIPETLVMDIHFNQKLLDGSPLNTNSEIPSQSDWTNTTDDTGDNLSRTFSFVDDE